MDTFARAHPSRPNRSNSAGRGTMSLSDCVPLRSLWGHDACTDSLARTLFSLIIIQDPLVQYSFLFCLRPRSHTGIPSTDDLKCDRRHVWHVCRHYTQSIKSQRRLLLRRYGERRRQQLPRNRQFCRLLAHLSIRTVITCFARNLPHFMRDESQSARIPHRNKG